MHSISAILCGAKVDNVKIRKNSGSVNVNKINTFIALSPYYVPIYSIFLIILWGVLRYILKLELNVEVFIFLLGLSITFHLVLTFYAVSVGQTDFNVSGWLFSLVTIFILNVVLLISIIIFLLPVKNSYKEVLGKVFLETKISYIKTYNILAKWTNNFLEKRKNNARNF
jgi:hypothetical protein